jgi:dTMP kinase
MPEKIKRGLVIALDGPDGVGKTTQVSLLVDYLKKRGLKTIATRNSGGTPIGEALRQVSLSDNPRPAETDVFISLAMGAALALELRKLKSTGHAVVIDRSPLALLAYNGYGSQLEGIKMAFDACGALFKRYNVDLLLFLAADPGTIKKRLQKRGTVDYFESQGKAYHDRVQEGYKAGLEFLQNHSDLGAKVVVVDANGDIGAIHKSVVKAVAKILK